MARFLIATPQAPIPPRNGVTAGPAALLRGLLARGHTVDVAWLSSGSTSDTGVGETRAAGAAVCEIAVRLRPLLGRVLGELLVGRPAFDRWSLAPAPPGLERPDLLWAAHRSSVGPALAIRARSGWREVPVVAGVNDIWTAVLETRARTPGLRGLLARLRRPFALRAERRLLAAADLVVVQSAHDAAVAVDALGLERQRVRILSNAAPEELFDLPLQRAGDGVGWVGDARARFYASAVRRLVDEMWPEVRAAHPSATFALIGPGTDRMATPPGVEGRGFMPSITDVYEPLRVLVAPIFKGHGRINKVIEAMASGVPVVGDETAFHGIDGFEPDRHGVVVRDWTGFAPAVNDLLDSPAKRDRIAREGRSLAEASFRWKDRIDAVESWLRAPATVLRP